MKVFIVLAYLIVFALAKSLSEKNAEFEAFKHKFDKTYTNAAEEGIRLAIFLNNLKTITDHNKLHEAGKISFSLGINQFADLTAKEFSEITNSYSHHPANYPTHKNVFKHSANAAPDSIDWRDYGYVTPVENESQCGSWAFSVTGSIEGQNAATTGNLVSLSEQQLTACCLDYLPGCSDGGDTIDMGFQCIINNYGNTSAGNYPLVGNRQKVGVCEDSGGIYASVSNYVDIASKDEDALKEACGTIGPISVAIDASHASFQLYNAGVYYEPECFQNILDHDVLIVGYGNEAGSDYWIVKNSWGSSWGEAGYIRMARNKDNNCGIATSASYPVI